MASFSVDKYTRDLYMENANFNIAGWSLSALQHIDRSAFNGVWIFEIEWFMTKLWQDYEGQTQVK